MERGILYLKSAIMKYNCCVINLFDNALTKQNLNFLAKN